MASKTQEPIAIIGAGCRFPGDICDVESYWQGLLNGIDAITEVPKDRWDLDALYAKDPKAQGKTYATRGGFINNIDQFDPEFFKILPREAAHIDPQQRFLLETAYEAIEDAGETPKKLSAGRTGVFAGVFIHDYQHIQLAERDLLNAHTGTGTAMSIAANRISYAFNLSGPSMSVDTACSSSLLAIHLACQSIRNGECDSALAGGVNIIIKPEMTIAMSKASMLSPDGRCFSFDSRANGYVRGEGSGMVLLKPLAQAIKDKNTIHSVVISSACNQDGRTVGISVPSGEAQEDLLKTAIKNAGLHARDIGYVEAHGTGTPVGDPIEANALGRVLSSGRDKDKPCVIGSVKSNMGHLESASGVAGLLKAALVLKHGKIPGNINFKKANPKIDLDTLQLRVLSETEDWQQDGDKIAGVNSFGFGGTNVHVLLKEPPKTSDILGDHSELELSEDAASGMHLIKFSAHSPEALTALVNQTSKNIEENTPNYADLAYTLNERRADHDYRIAFAAKNITSLKSQLDRFSHEPVELSPVNTASSAQKPLFVFTGMGPQWWSMGQELLKTEKVFRDVIEACDLAFKPLTKWSLIDELEKSEDDSRIQDTTVAQPAIFSIQVALWALWESWGIKPSAVLGHSVGEIAAAHVAGALTFKDAVTLTYYRSQLQSRMRDTGAMLAVGVSKETVLELFPVEMETVSIAAENGPMSVTLSGDKIALQKIEKGLAEKDHFARFLKVEVPYHSSKMEVIRADLLEALKNLRPQKTTIKFISTVTGSEICGTKLDADYWWRNVRFPVYFAKSIINWCENYESNELPPIIEIGPHPVLSGAIQECLVAAGKSALSVHSLRRGQKEKDNLLLNLTQLYQIGFELDWSDLTPKGKFISLPKYPWQRISCWSESEISMNTRKGYSAQTMVAAKGKKHPLLGQQLDLASMVWNQTITLDRYPYLADHKIQNEVVFPGAGYIEMIAAALDVEWGSESCVVSDLSLDKALFIPESEAVTLECRVEENNRFVISSKQESRPEWDKHCSAKSYKKPSVLQPVWDLDAIQRRCDNEIPADYLYKLFEYIGFGYGPKFQRIVAMYQGDDECLAKIEGIEDESGYGFHPTWLDASLHSIFGALSLTAQDADMRDQAYLPVSIKSCHLINPVKETFSWSHARITHRSKYSFSADVVVYDEQGLPLVHIEQLRCEAIEYSHQKLQKNAAKWLYKFAWKKSEFPEVGLDTKSTWLVFVNEQSQFLSGILEDHKQTVIQVSASSDYTKIADNEFHISPEDSDHYQKLIDDIVRSGFKIDHVVHSFAFDSDFDPSFNADDIMALQTQGFGSIVYYLQAQNTLEEKPSSFTLITCNAFDCENAKELNFEQSHLVGLTRVMGNEMPELLVKCVDIDVSLTSQEKDNLFVELNGSTLDEEVSIRGSSRFVRRLMRWQPENEVAEIIGDTQSFAMSFKETGDVDSLQYTPVPISLPKANEVAIKVSYAALNFKDVLKASGLFPTDLMEENLWSGDSLGMECSGTVTACGSDVKDIAVGTRVMALAPNSLRSDTTTHASLVVPITNLSDEQAAAMPMVFLTAYYGLIELARLKKGERVLIHAAAGGVGQAAIQLAQWVGAEIYATCGSESKRDFLKNLGVHNIYDSRSSSFAKDILNDTDGQGVDVVLNSLAGSLIDLGLSLLRDYGRFVEIGKMDINRDKGIGLKPFHYNLSFFAVDLDRMLEQRPEDCGAMLNALDELIRAGKIKPIKTTCFSTGTASEAFKTMLSGEHMGKLVVSFNDDAGVKMARSESPVFDHKSNYLITGGLGGFGSSLAHWLVDHGARHLTLLGRSGAHSPSAKRLVSELEGRGTKVTVIPADVSDRKHVEKIRNAMDEKYPLKGIFHAAGILDDALLLKQDMDKFNRVAATKISGSWNLHTLSKSFDLDYFVMFSSVATSLGNQGSGNYAAANAFMDGLSHFRKQHGLSALSVNWGVIADVGMAADEDFYRRSLEENGLRALHSRDGLDLMGLMLLEKETQITVSPVDWEKWLRFNPAGGKTRYSELVLAQAKGQSSSQSVEEKSMREKLSSVEKGEIRAVATEEVQQVLAKLFGFDAKKILPEKSLTNLGMDSLMAVELKVRLDRFGVAIPVATLLRDMNVNKIVNTMLAHFELANEESSNKNDLESPLKGEWLVVHEPRPKAKYRMFCFPYAGAGPVVYQNWQEQLSSEIEVVSIHLPGRGSRLDEHAMTQISMMSTAIVNAMQDKLDKPIIFFGHCMGAIVMSEVAAQLKESNSIDADHIFVSGCMAPHLYNSPLVYGLEQKKFIDVLDLISFTSASAMHKGKEIVELMTPMLRADFEAVAHYFETKTKVIKFSSPITGFAAKHDLFAAPSAMRAWERYSEGKFKLNMLDGDHYFIESDQDIIIESINRTLGFSANTEIDMDRFENVESIGYDKREKCIEYGVIKQTPLGAINKDILYWVDGYSPEKNTLFCFPGAWENRTIPEYIPQDIGDDWQVAVVQYPGHGMRESEGCCLEIKPIIVELASALFNYIDKPFAFLGHCVGGLIQYEVAKLFKSQAHTEPQFMLVSAVVNPEIYTAPNGHLLDDSKLLELLDVIDCPLMDLLRNEGDNTKLLSLVRSDLELMANYVSSKPIVFDCPITVITGRNDLWTYPLQANSWHRLTSAQENVVHVHEGTHYLNKTSQQLFLKSIQRLIKIGDLHELLVSE